VEPKEYRDLIAGYIARNFAVLEVYTEISLGKSIIGKNRKIDVFLVRPTDQLALAIECKYQDVPGTTDEKIPYALADLEAMWIPGCLVYAGEGWSPGVLHTLRASPRAAQCLPAMPALARTKLTWELDHILAARFGLWSGVLPQSRRFKPAQLAFPVDVESTSPGRRRGAR
jgi:hypothetical protein